MTYAYGDQLAALADAGITADAHLVSVRLTLTQGPTEFAFLDEATATLQAADGGTSETLLGYSRSSAPTSGGTIELAPSLSPDVVQYVQEGSITLNAELTGTFPTQAWQMSMEACLDVRAHMDLSSIARHL